MKTKILLTVIIAMFSIIAVNAQTHDNSKGACRLFKSKYSGVEPGASCSACVAKDKKEQEARDTENKRRNDAIIADAKAKQKASENLRLEKLRLEKEEEKRIKDKEIADKIAEDNAIKRYKEIAESGRVKSNVKGDSQEINLTNIECFTDREKKIYGFKINEKEVLTFPFEDDQTYFSRLGKSNYFLVTNHKKIDDDRYSSYCYIINHLGKKIVINGVSKFDGEKFDTKNKNNSNIYLYKNIAEPELIGEYFTWNISNLGLLLFDNKESAIADFKSRVRRGGMGIYRNYYVSYITLYTLDSNCNFLVKKDLYTWN